MAYRPTNNIKENVIHRNTIFDGQGMVSCCTCGYCIKRNEEATLELTNFKAAPPIKPPSTSFLEKISLVSGMNLIVFLLSSANSTNSFSFSFEISFKEQ